MAFLFKFYNTKSVLSRSKLMALLCCIWMLFIRSSNAWTCAENKDCRYITETVGNKTVEKQLEICCHDYYPPRCINLETHFPCTDVINNTQFPTLTILTHKRFIDNKPTSRSPYEKDATSKSSSSDDYDHYGDDDDDDGSRIVIPVLIAVLFVVCMCCLGCAVSRKKSHQENTNTSDARTARVHQEELSRLQQRARAEQIARLYNTVERVDRSSRTHPEIIHIARMTPTAPEMRGTNRHSNSNVNLPSNNDAIASNPSHGVNVHVQPGSLSDAPPSYADVFGTNDVNLPLSSPPKYHDVV